MPPGAREGLDRTWFAVNPEPLAAVAASLATGPVAVTTLRRRMVGALDGLAEAVREQGAPPHLARQSLRLEVVRLRLQECSPDQLAQCLDDARRGLAGVADPRSPRRSAARRRLVAAGLDQLATDLVQAPLSATARALTPGQRWRARSAAWGVLREVAPWLPWRADRTPLNPAERLQHAAWHASVAARTSDAALAFRAEALTRAVRAWPATETPPVSLFPAVVDLAVAGSLAQVLPAVAPSAWLALGLAQRSPVLEPRTRYYLALWTSTAASVTAWTQPSRRSVWRRRACEARDQAHRIDAGAPPLQRRLELLRLDGEIEAITAGHDEAVRQVGGAVADWNPVATAGRGELAVPAVHTAFFVLRWADGGRQREFDACLELALALVPREDAGPGRLLRQHLQSLVTEAVRRGATTHARALQALASTGLELPSGEGLTVRA